MAKLFGGRGSERGRRKFVLEGARKEKEEVSSLRGILRTSSMIDIFHVPPQRCRCQLNLNIFHFDLLHIISLSKLLS